MKYTDSIDDDERERLKREFNMYQIEYRHDYIWKALRTGVFDLKEFIDWIAYIWFTDDYNDIKARVANE